MDGEIDKVIHIYTPSPNFVLFMCMCHMMCVCVWGGVTHIMTSLKKCTYHNYLYIPLLFGVVPHVYRLNHKHQEHRLTWR